MLFEITKQLEKDILLKNGSKSGNKLKAGASSNALSVRPVLQLNYIPEGIDISQYKNPFGPTNPGGDYLSLYRFRELTNNISQFIKYYSPSGKKIDKVYKSIVEGATVKGLGTYAANTIFDSRQELQNFRLGNFTGTPDGWYPVYATPDNWYDRITQKNALFSTEIDFSNPSGVFNNQFTILDNKVDENLDWSQVDENRAMLAKPLEKGSAVKKIKFKFLQVHLNRPWFNLDLFEMDGWYLGGQQTGYISTGETNRNNGVFPLYPTSFLIATDLVIEGDFDRIDLAFVSEKIKAHGSVNLGPFNINTLDNGKLANESVMKNDGYFIVAWISQLIDFSPKIDK